MPRWLALSPTVSTPETVQLTDALELSYELANTQFRGCRTITLQEHQLTMIGVSKADADRHNDIVRLRIMH